MPPFLSFFGVVVLAQASPAPTGAEGWMSVALWLLGGTVAIVTIWDKFRQRPAAHEIFATKEEVRLMEERAVKQMGEMKTELKGVAGKVDSLSNGVMSSLNTLNVAVGRIEGRLLAEERRKSN